MALRDESSRGPGKVLQLDRLPFFTGVLDSPDNRGLPLALPFTLALDGELGLIVSRHERETIEAMEVAYRLGSLVSTTLGEGSFGERRGRDAIDHLVRAAGGDVRGLSFLEVGCAGGYLLRRLAGMGASRVLGCEPGPAALEGRRMHGIDIIHDFFRRGLVREIVDVAFSYGVLEHIEHPREFLEAMAETLREGGRIFIGVPNCGGKLALGDLEVLGHEHWNYFTEGSLAGLLQRSGFSGVETATGMNQAMVYGWGIKSPGVEPPPPDNCEKTLFQDFAEKVWRLLPILQERVDALERREGTLGLYAGGINTIGLLRHRREPRFFNSDVAVHGKFYPGFGRPIEDPRNLQDGTVDELWIMATDYDGEIRRFLEEDIRIPEKTEVFSIRDCLLQMGAAAQAAGIQGNERSKDHDSQ